MRTTTRPRAMSLSRQRGLAASLALASASALVLASPPATSQAATAGTELKLTFERSSLRANSGKAALDIDKRRHNRGDVRRASGRTSSTEAARFPAFRAGSPPLAVLTVVDRRGADDLSPRRADFRFGADFRLDSESWGSSADNGDNLVQRGLYGSSMQYKIDIDKRRPGCRVKGSAGAVMVRSSRAVRPGTWYRTRCIRDGDRVVLRVKRLGTSTSWTVRDRGSIGSVAAKSSRLPLSIGGKVKASGRILTGDSDQFNGRVDNVVLRVAD